jgi:hypothetical protein
MADARNGGVKTLAIQLSDEEHAQLVLISQVEGLSLKDILKQAVEALIASKRAEADFATRAAAVLEEMEREATTRRQAIESLVGTAPAATDQATTTSRRRGKDATP